MMKQYLERFKEIYGKRDEAFAGLYWLMLQAVPYRKQLLIMFAISMVSLGMGFVGTIAGKFIVDATTSGTLNLMYICYMAGATVFSIVFSALSSIFSAYINEKFSFGMRCDMFDRVQRSVWIELSKFHSGDIVTRLTSDISNISSGLISVLPSTVVLAIRLLISFCILLYYDRWIAIFALFIAPIGAVSALLYQKKYRYYQSMLRESESEYRSFMQENMSNIVVVKAFQQEQDNNAYMEDIRRRRMNLVMRSAKLGALMSGLMKVIYNSGYVVAFCWSAYRISKGEITYGTMTVFLSLVSQIQGSVSSLGSILPQIYGMLVSAKRITEIVDIRDEEYRHNTCLPEEVSVEISDLTFAYNTRNILEHVNIRVKPGEIVGIIGSSGAGKTTLIRLLLSLIRPNSGSVEYTFESGNREQAQPSSRRFIAYVPQGNTLMSGSIERNLRIGKKDATDKEIWEALRMADVEEFVLKSEDGLETVLAEKAGGLSEGQAQRIAIARALIRKKPILILDEATSALDEDTESRILSAISENYGKTCFIITHRRSMLKYCDRVIEVREDGVYERDSFSRSDERHKNSR